MVEEFGLSITFGYKIYVL